MKTIRTYVDAYEVAEQCFWSYAKPVKKGKSHVSYREHVRMLQGKDGKEYGIRVLNVPLFVKTFGFPTSQFNAIKWVMSTSQLQGLNRLVAITIASFYNADKGYAFPNIDQVADICGISVRSVSSAVQQMKASGEWLVVPVQTFRDSKPRSNRYYLLPPFGYGGRYGPEMRQDATEDKSKPETVVEMKYHNMAAARLKELAEEMDKQTKKMQLSQAEKKGLPEPKADTLPSLHTAEVQLLLQDKYHFQPLLKQLAAASLTCTKSYLRFPNPLATLVSSHIIPEPGTDAKSGTEFKLNVLHYRAFVNYYYKEQKSSPQTHPEGTA